MYILNKIVGGCLNPLAIGFVLIVAGGLCLWRNCRKTGFGLLAGSVAWLWVWSAPVMYRWLGGSLEDEWPVVRAEDSPDADAIVLLGGGMGSNTNVYPYAEMLSGADRVWHAARLYKSGKAPLVIPLPDMSYRKYLVASLETVSDKIRQKALADCLRPNFSAKTWTRFTMRRWNSKTTVFTREFLVEVAEGKILILEHLEKLPVGSFHTAGSDGTGLAGRGVYFLPDNQSWRSWNAGWALRAKRPAKS